VDPSAPTLYETLHKNSWFSGGWRRRAKHASPHVVSLQTRDLWDLKLPTVHSGIPFDSLAHRKRGFRTSIASGLVGAGGCLAHAKDGVLVQASTAHRAVSPPSSRSKPTSAAFVPLSFVKGRTLPSAAQLPTPANACVALSHCPRPAPITAVGKVEAGTEMPLRRVRLVCSASNGQTVKLHQPRAVVRTLALGTGILFR